MITEQKKSARGVTKMQQPIYRNNEYRQQDVLGASPVHLVVMAYDVAIRACEQNDYEKAVKTIGLLRDALDFDYPEVAMGLFRIYQWCLDCIRKNDFTSALGTLRELRGAWRQAELRPSPAAASQPRRTQAAISA
jgi:flagellin-specific chaperone FliS